MVKRQMIQALVQLALMGSGFILGIIGILRGEMGLMLVILPQVITIGISLMFKPFEYKAMNLLVEDSSLQDEYRRVCESWRGKAFPDF